MKKNDLNTIRNQLKKCRSALREREKELGCVYCISGIVDSFTEPERIIQEIVNIVPRSWQFPEIACCRAKLKGKLYLTDNFLETEYQLGKDITISGKKVGKIEVFYLEKPAGTGKNPFLKAEVSLLGVVAERLGKIYERKNYEKKLEDSYGKLQELYEHMQSVTYEERKKIAAEVHDELGQAFTSLKIDMRWLSNRLRDSQLLEKTGDMEILLDETLEKVQQIAKELRPVLLDDFGLSEALKWYTEDIGKKSGLNIRMNLDNIDSLTDKNASVLIYQIIKELVTNTIRHAGAKEIDIKISRTNEKLEIFYADDGVGIQKEKIYDIKSFGIFNLRERVNYWSGMVEVSSEAGRGTIFRISLPFPMRVKK